MRLSRTGFSVALAASAILAASAAVADPAKIVNTQKVAVRVETIASGLDHPWAVEALPDGAYLVTERPGSMRIIRNGKVSEPVAGLPEVHARGQGGLLDVALDPRFANNRTIFFAASISEDGGSGTAVFHAVLSPDERRLTDVKRIFLMNKLSRGNIQYGSRIAIAKDGAKAQPEIWSKGHRNPQGITFDAADGRLYTAEHGARGGDEINTPEPGKNYGWPVISYGRNYSGTKIGIGTAKEGMEQPIFYWDPSIAPGAIAVYRGKMFPEWNGDLLVTALKFELLSRLDRDGSGKVVEQERLFEGDFGRLRDIVVAPDGALLITTDEDDGALLRVSRATN